MSMLFLILYNAMAFFFFFKMAYGHSVPQTLSKMLYCVKQYTQLMIHSFVKHCSSLVSENSCLVFSVRLGTNHHHSRLVRDR